jgi:hypothetical protein
MYMSTELKGFATLFSETWEQFKVRGLTILGVVLVSSLLILGSLLLLGIVVAVFMGGMESAFQQVQQGQINLPMVVIFAVFFLLFILLAMWSQSATIAVAVDESIGVREALRVGWRRLWSMGWILLLVGSIVITGFLFFIIPGIMFSVSLLFALYPLYDDDLRGMDAVLASHYYVKGRWWNTFGKLLLIWLIAIVLDLIPLIGQALYFLFTPFLFLFLVAVYRNLKETAVVVPAPEGRSRWWLLAGSGIILTILGTVGALVTLGPQLPTILQQIQQQAGYQTGSAGPRAAVPEVSRKKQDTARQDVPVAAGTSRDTWRDPVGDVSEFGVGRWLDIETVSVKAETGFLVIDTQIHFPLAASFNAASTTSQSLYRLAVLYFDTDGNRQTGGTAGEDSGRSGYDFGLDVTLEAPRNAPEKGRIHVGLFRFDNDQRKFLGPLPENQVQVRGNQIRITVPYTVLGMQAGDQLRMSFVESFQKQGSGLSKDKLITL